MEINSFVVKVFSSDVCVYNSGPRKISAAVEIYQNCIGKYLNGFAAKKEGFSGHYSLLMYSDLWILEMFKKYRDTPEFAENYIRNISHKYFKGHMRIEFNHSDKFEFTEVIFKDGQLVIKEDI